MASHGGIFDTGLIGVPKLKYLIMIKKTQILNYEFIFFEYRKICVLIQCVIVLIYKNFCLNGEVKK